MADENAMQEAMNKMHEAFKGLSREEIAAVKEFQKEVDEAAKAGNVSDTKLEFCYAIKFGADKISNEALRAACDEYIKAAEA